MSNTSAQGSDADTVVATRGPQRRIIVRPLALLLAVIFQLPLLFLFAPLHREHEREMSPMQLVILERFRPRPESRVVQPSQAQEVEHSTDIVVPQPSLAPIQPTEDRQQTDWTSSASAAAQAAVEDAIRRESHKPLGPRDKPATPNQQDAPSLFEKPKNRLGMVDHDEPGVATVWLSDNCYIKLDKFITPRAGDSPRIPRCFVPFGRKEARGDLFERMDEQKEEQKP